MPGQVKSLLRGFTIHNAGTPDRTLAAANHVIHQTRLTLLTTCIVMHLQHTATDPSCGLTLTWSNAGHPSPIMVAPSGTTTVLDLPRDPALGATAAATRTSAATRLPPGTTLVMFSDGLFEQRTLDYDTAYTHLRHTISTLADTLCDELLHAAPHDDDVVLIALRQRRTDR